MYDFKTIDRKSAVNLFTSNTTNAVYVKTNVAHDLLFI